MIPVNGVAHLIRPHLWIDAEIVKKRRMRAAHYLERRHSRPTFFRCGRTSAVVVTNGRNPGLGRKYPRIRCLVRKGFQPRAHPLRYAITQGAQRWELKLFGVSIFPW